MPDATGDLRVDSPKQYEASQSTWDSIAESREFKDLMATKKIFIVPAFIFLRRVLLCAAGAGRVCAGVHVDQSHGAR